MDILLRWSVSPKIFNPVESITRSVGIFSIFFIAFSLISKLPARRRMMEVLHERHLKLSCKKSRIGCIKNGFHFLGINYFPTQTENNTTVTHVWDFKTLVEEFIRSCWHEAPVAIAASVLSHYLLKLSRTCFEASDSIRAA